MGHGWWFLDTTLLPHGPTPNDAFSNFGFRDYFQYFRMPEQAGDA
jgi:hypothetical protein